MPPRDDDPPHEAHMFGSVLEVAIGVIFVFLLASIICSAIREGIEAFFKTRAAYLERGIRELLDDRHAQGLAKHVYEHPLVAGMYRDDYQPSDHTTHRWPLARGRDLPAYIPARNFALALLDIAARGPIDRDNPARNAQAWPISLAVVKANLSTMPSSIQRVLMTAIDVAQGDLTVARHTLETWYDDAMDRVSSWYKRSTQMILFVIGLVFAVVVNVDTIAIARYLSHDSAAREAIVARAQAAVNDTAYLSRSYAQAKQDLESLKLPIGWDAPGVLPVKSWPEKILGLFITALAVTMGAPFWFDLLNKVTAIRSAVKPTPKPSAAPPEEPVMPAVVAPAGATPVVVPPGAAMSLSVAAAHASPEEHVDTCDVEVMSETPDDQLPPAEGGVRA